MFISIKLEASGLCICRFTDKPVRLAGQLSTARFAGTKSEGNDTAWLDTPNAVLVGGDSAGGLLAVVITLSSPAYDEQLMELTYQVGVLHSVSRPILSPFTDDEALQARDCF